MKLVCTTPSGHYRICVLLNVLDFKIFIGQMLPAFYFYLTFHGFRFTFNRMGNIFEASCLRSVIIICITMYSSHISLPVFLSDPCPLLFSEFLKEPYFINMPPKRFSKCQASKTPAIGDVVKKRRMESESTSPPPTALQYNP